MTPTRQTVIKVENLHKYYKDVKAVNGISFEVFEGEIFGIVGPNGAGKTTMVECIEGLRTPDKGIIEILGLTPRKDGQTLRQQLSIQLQEGLLPQKLKVWEALDLFASLYKLSLPWQPLLEDLALSDKRNSYFETLSGGQKQRLFIAMSLVNDPRIVFFDELTTGLDPQARRSMWDMVKRTRDRGKTVVLVTHFMDEAERLCDRVAIVDKGQIIALDTPANLIKGLNTELQIMVSLDDPWVLSEVEKLSNISKIQRNGEQIVIYCNNDKAVDEVVSIFTKNNIRFYDYSVGGPSLEDVFLSLTGERMRD
ncbi:ABC transporter ATP-binding protein [Dehalococcoidia bacterium]|nr:ABC transporter ATP-binding protein [Dehalococcoidia bacterium]